MLLQSKMRSARKVKGQADHEIASPISNVLYQMRKYHVVKIESTL